MLCLQGGMSRYRVKSVVAFPPRMDGRKARDFIGIAGGGTEAISRPTLNQKLLCVGDGFDCTTASTKFRPSASGNRTTVGGDA